MSLQLTLTGRFFALVLLTTSSALAVDPEVATERMKLMRERCEQIQVKSDIDSFPNRLSSQPLFRYADEPRHYVDGSIWLLSAAGQRPKAIVTTELNSDFYGTGEKIIYEFLSLTDEPFELTSPDIPGWKPRKSETSMAPFPRTNDPGETTSERLQQMKAMALRCRAWQVVDGNTRKLRLTPDPIVRFGNQDDATDGAIFVFSSFTMPGLILLLESDGQRWQYGVGRLSRGTELGLAIDGDEVWNRSPVGRSWTRGFTSCNADVVVPK